MSASDYEEERSGMRMLAGALVATTTMAIAVVAALLEVFA